MVEANVKWTGGVRFEGKSFFGHAIATDVARDAGGTENGFKPSELLLFAVAGCSGIDIVRVLEKMRQEVTGFDIEVKGFQPEDYPRPFNRIEVRYILRGPNLDAQKVEKAISLSKEKYCMVSQSLKSAEIVTTYEIIKE